MYFPPKSFQLTLKLVVICATWVALLVPKAPGQSFTPDHPKVVEMVNRGVAFLAGKGRIRQSGMYEMGAPIMAGYAVLKVTGDANHATVKVGIEAAQRISDSLAARSAGSDSKIVYEAGVACVLLASADAIKYRKEIENIRDWFVKNQKSHGGFGYPDRPGGDTSQVQYAVLALWTMHQAGIPVPMDTVEDVVTYLKRTQDPGGGWGYEGVLGNGLVSQSVTKSLATAGSGAIIMGGDVLGFYGVRSRKAVDADGIPTALIRTDVRDQLPAQRRKVTMSKSDTDGTIASATRYLDSIANQTNIPQWYFYWRYSQERYESFREIYNGKSIESPAWYNSGVADLMGLQEQDGSWGGSKRVDHTPTEVSTAFAILYLIRSTQQAIGKINEGLLSGGYGLPNNVASVQRVGDKLVSAEEISVENLLQRLEGSDSDDVEFSLVPKNLQLDPDPTIRAAQVARLSRLLFTKDWKARRVAAKLLGRSDDFDQAPDLIQALTDEDSEVPLLAEESLRLISRKLNVRIVQFNPDLDQKKKAYEYWKAWYLGIRPDYEFLER